MQTQSAPGDYGETTSTDISYVSFTTKYETRRMIFKFTVPHVRITGPGSLVGDTVVSGGADGRRTESGVGDMVAATFFNLSPGVGKMPLIDLGVKVKFGTGDEDKGLGTGEEDYSLQLDLADKLGKFTIFGTLGYKWRGEPEGLELNDGAFASIGGGCLATLSPGSPIRARMVRSACNSLIARETSHRAATPPSVLRQHPRRSPAMFSPRFCPSDPCSAATAHLCDRLRCLTLSP